MLITRQTEPAAPRTLPAALDPRRPPVKLRGPRWSRVAVYAVAVFVVAMGIVTGIELIGQKPVSPWCAAPTRRGPRPSVS